ncbi:elongation factor G, partial [Francisella tularensis subsp. holarctica]|nr:elongation factor G [Francisella tularensis subsp. holarctica]
SKVDQEAKIVRKSGGRVQYGLVFVRFEPLDEVDENGEDKVFKFVDEVVGGVVPKEYIGSVAIGIEEQLNNGVLAGYPMIVVKSTL